MNAKTEFINHVSGRKVLCAKISKTNSYYGGAPPQWKILTTGWVEEEWNEFLSMIDFEYDAGYGGQELFGTIWYTDGTWSTRGEYDGSEWWQHHDRPIIPTELNRIDKVRDQKLGEIL